MACGPTAAAAYASPAGRPTTGAALRASGDGSPQSGAPPRWPSAHPRPAWRPALRLLLLATRDAHAGQGGSDKDDGKHDIAILKGHDERFLAQILAQHRLC